MLRLTNALPHTMPVLSGNMSEYKASCYALRRAVRAAKLLYRERIESHFQLNDSRRMWQGLETSVPLEITPPQSESRSIAGRRVKTPSTAALNVMAVRLCRLARQEAADRAAMMIMLSPCRRTRFGGN